MKTAGAYIRVSTSKKVASSPVGKIEDKFLQNPEVQLVPLKKLCEQRGFQVKVYQDRMSGASTKRPGFRALMEDARRGELAAVVVWRFDRFARSTRELINALEEFKQNGVDFISHQEAIDTSTPVGKMTFTVLAAVAEMERAIITERVRAGLDHAREHGTRSGKPIGRPPRVIEGRDQIVELRKQGVSLRELARRFRVGIGTVHRACSTTLVEKRGNAGGRERG